MKNLELQEEICDALAIKDGYDYKDLCNIDPVEIDGVKYLPFEVEDLDTTDEGKYQYGGVIYGIAEIDDDFNAKGNYLFYIEQDFTQTGSYYSEQYREYEAPYIVEKKEVVKTVWVAK